MKNDEQLYNISGQPVRGGRCNPPAKMGFKAEAVHASRPVSHINIAQHPCLSGYQEDTKSY